MPGCAVFGCSNYTRKTKGTDIKYYSFPKNKILSKRWIIACRRKDEINLKNACICSIHFDPSNFELPLQQQLLTYQPKSFRNLKVDALPTLHLPLSSNNVSKRLNSVERSGRLIKRKRHTEVNQIFESISNTVETFPVKVEMVDPLLIKNEPQEDLRIETLQNKILHLEAENSFLKVQLEQYEQEKTVLKKELLTSKNEIPEIIRRRLEEILTPEQLKVIMNPLKKNK